jgi:hypothetical protein
MKITFSLYSAFTVKVKRNCHFLASGWNCMTQRQSVQGFLDGSQVSFHRNSEMTFLKGGSAGSREVTVTFNFIIEHADNILFRVFALCPEEFRRSLSS